jgi:competence protein ComEC
MATLGGLPTALTALRDSEVHPGQWCDTAHAGMSLLQGLNARLYVLYPFDVQVPTALDSATDNRCIAVKLQYGAVSFLFTGDADRSAEAEMVEAYGPLLRSSLLKAAHHGSNTSSSPLFLEAVRPSAVVISVGRHNKFRHPSPQVVERIGEMCGPPSRTDDDGAVMYETDGRSLWKLGWR